MSSRDSYFRPSQAYNSGSSSYGFYGGARNRGPTTVLDFINNRPVRRIVGYVVGLIAVGSVLVWLFKDQDPKETIAEGFTPI
ncbi:hypothetical protein V1514DRAFT_321908 [Lipomyces japonicus]|uniref:uncharacterized protein n=1 Tax=Lipomyces japonicus TaxID=56871 RepID=UPI0034CEBA8B